MRGEAGWNATVLRCCGTMLVVAVATGCRLAGQGAEAEAEAGAEAGRGRTVERVRDLERNRSAAPVWSLEDS